MAPRVEVRGLVNRFGTQIVHEGLDMTVEAGEIFGIVGGSGAGKSVLLRSILGLQRPLSGTVCLCGKDVTRMTQREMRAVKSDYGVTFQEGALFSALTVLQNVQLPMLEYLRLTVVMITHDLDTIFRTCNRVGVIVDRRMVSDTLTGIVDNPHPWIQAYFHGVRARGHSVRAGEA